MAEYIEKQAAIDALAEQIVLCDKALKSFGISMKDEYAVKVERASLIAYKEQLEAIHAADVVPVVHARWVSKPNIYGVAYCSKCDYELHTNDTNYCPNCGAKMDGGKNT